MNKDVIDAIRNSYKEFKSTLPNTQTFKFTNKDISMNSNGILIDNTAINKKAEQKLLARMKVRPEFIELADKATEADWKIITDNLKDILQDRPYYAKIHTNNNNDEIFEILDYPHYEKTNLLSNDKSIDKICEELDNTNDSYNLFGIHIDVETNTIIINLVNEDTKFSIFQNDSKDKWLSGVQYKFTETEFESRHFLERLVCTNGMATKEECYKRTINNKNFNQEKINKIISQTFKDSYKEIFAKIAKQANILKEHNISIREFYTYSKKIMVAGKKLKIEPDLKKIFDDSIFFSVYGQNVKENSTKWQSTADSGINAYNFFNALTYSATHVFTNLSPKVATDLQLSVSNFFFVKNFDLDEIAPKVNIKYINNHIAYN